MREVVARMLRLWGFPALAPAQTLAEKYSQRRGCSDDGDVRVGELVVEVKSTDPKRRTSDWTGPQDWPFSWGAYLTSPKAMERLDRRHGDGLLGFLVVNAVPFRPDVVTYIDPYRGTVRRGLPEDHLWPAFPMFWCDVRDRGDWFVREFTDGRMQRDGARQWTAPVSTFRPVADLARRLAELVPEAA